MLIALVLILDFQQGSEARSGSQEDATLAPAGGVDHR
jgi:hypothetical protein